MFNAARLARMKRGAFIVNTARGGIIDEPALHAALTSGHLAGAGLDVFDMEPTPVNNTLLQLDTVITSPHMAGVTTESVAGMAMVTAENILSVLDGKPNRDNVINQEVLMTISPLPLREGGVRRGHAHAARPAPSREGERKCLLFLRTAAAMPQPDHISKLGVPDPATLDETCGHLAEMRGQAGLRAERVQRLQPKGLSLDNCIIRLGASERKCSSSRRGS